MYPYLFAALAPMLWGSTYAAVGLYLAHMPPLWIAVWRALGAGIFLLLILRRMPKMEFSKVFTLGFFNIGLFFIFLMIAAYRLPGSVAGTLGATFPLQLILIQWLVLRQAPELKPTVAAITGFIGVLLLLNPSANLDPLGVACALGATLMITIASLLTKHWQVTDILGVTTWQLLSAGLVLVPVAFFVEGMPPAVEMSHVPGLVWLAILNTAVGCLFAVNAIKQVGPNVFGMMSLLNPVVAVTLGITLLSESLDVTQWIGMAIIFASLIVANVRFKKRLGQVVSCESTNMLKRF